jgi:hypothetical protein
MSDDTLNELAQLAYETYQRNVSKVNETSTPWYELEWEQQRAWRDVVEELLRLIGLRQLLR